MTVPRIRIRAKKPKTKTGCKTCRIRRIKCDESRPDCRKCSSTGRLCEWYDDLPDRNKSSKDDALLSRIVAPSPLAIRPWYAPLRHLSSLEGQAFTFFRHHTALQMQGSFDSKLWNSWAMQLSHSEPAVMHAIVAVGSLHQARSGLNQAFQDNADGRVQDDHKQHRFALQQYTKAIVLLKENIEGEQTCMTVDVVLLTCLLFVGFELLRGDVLAAMKHLDKGLGIVSLTHANHLNDYASSMGTATDHLIDELVPAFARLDYASTMFGQRHPVLDLEEHALSKSLCIPERFGSAQEAKSYLELLASGTFRLLGELLQKAQDAALISPDANALPPPHRECYVKALSRTVDLGTASSSILATREVLEHGLLGFGTAFEGLLGAPETSSDRSVMAIYIEYVQILFLVTKCRETLQMPCDAFSPLFKRSVELAAEYMASAPRFSDSKPKRAFALEPGILPTVFLVAEKCRDPGIRGTAIKLMREGCAQEAMWDGKPYSTFMQELAHVEAGCRDQYPDQEMLGFNSGMVLEEQHLPTESARMCDVVLVGEAGHPQDAKLICARYRHESDGSLEIAEHAVDLASDSDYLHDLCYGWR